MSEPHPIKRHNPLQRGIRLQNYEEFFEFPNKSEILCLLFLGKSLPYLGKVKVNYWFK